ncbi:hypothetical protein [Arcicella rigui]|uniref:Outer membrane protein beta-barrel domain-containing protein n=1 Tax=Arcicella rigui TaxID=797020 RepID=A0ABU5QB78_9BACT|nr:hypothetical protein [Arcicella rigui]MEA5140081.1 hypothetical protein [Arcicella rigui]
MKQKTFTRFFFLCTCLICYFGVTLTLGQDTTSVVNSINPKSSRKFGLGVNLGTTPGVTLAYGLSPQLAIRLGYSYFKYSPNTTLKASGEDVKLSGDINMSILGLSVEYLPFKKSSFKVFGGVSYIDKGDLSVILTPTGTYTFGSTVFSPDEIGNVSFKVDYGKSIAPFAGIGFGRAIPKSRVGFGFEVGTYYTQSPVVNLTGEKRLSSMSEQQAKVQENMKDWQYWPILNLRVVFRLN